MADFRAEQLNAETIRQAYRLLLGRDPEPEMSFEEAISYYGTLGNLRADILRSSEFQGVARRVAMQSSAMDWVLREVFDHSVMYLNGKDIGVSRSILFENEWEPDVLSCLSTHFDPATTFLDVGANLGYFSLWAAEKVQGHGGHVMSVEANPRVVPYLSASIVQSRAGDVVTLIPLAASDYLGYLNFNQDAEGNLGGSGIGSHVEESSRVVCAPLDAVLPEHQPRIGFIKLDVEGSEPAAIRGLTGTIAKDRPFLLLEFNHSKLASLGSSAEQLVNLVMELGYEPFRRATDGSYQVSSKDLELGSLSTVPYSDILFKPATS